MMGYILSLEINYKDLITLLICFNVIDWIKKGQYTKTSPDCSAICTFMHVSL